MGTGLESEHDQRERKSGFGAGSLSAFRKKKAARSGRRYLAFYLYTRVVRLALRFLALKPVRIYRSVADTLSREVFQRENRGSRAHRSARATIKALVRMDIELLFR